MCHRRGGAAAALALAIALVPSLVHARVDDWRQVPAPPLKLQRPEPERVTLPNGIQVFLLENHRLPLVSLQAMVRTGSLYEPEDEAGVAEATGTLMRMGGTTRMKPDSLDEALDFLAADVSTSIGTDSGVATLNVPSSAFADALPLFAEILMHPAFDAQKLEIVRGQLKEEIRRQNDNPIQIGIREYSKLIYGEHHPAGRSPTFASVNHLTRDQLVAFHQRYFHPQNVMIGVAGDFDSARMKAQLKAAFADWKQVKVEFPPIPAPAPLTARNVNLARKTVDQSVILAGHLGTTVHDPDHVAIDLMNDILGGQGFSSRIVQTIRNDRGLAYFAGSFVQLGTIEPGFFVGISLTQADSTTVALDLLLKEIEKIRTQAVSAKELDDARTHRLNTEVFEYDSPEKVVNRLLYLEYNALPKDFFQKDLDAVAGMTAERIQSAASAFLKPGNLDILVVGDDARFNPPLKSFGEVRQLELKDPTEEGKS